MYDIRKKMWSCNWFCFDLYTKLYVQKPNTHSWLITRFVTKVTQWVTLVEQELVTLLEHMGSPQVFSGVFVVQLLVLCVVFCRLLFVFFSFFLWPLFFLSFDLKLLSSIGLFKLFLRLVGTQYCCKWFDLL